MKAIIFSIFISLVSLSSFSQTADLTQVGKVLYYEGKVELGDQSQWQNAKIDSPVLRNQSIRIPGDGMAEILWNSGVKTVVGPESSMSIKSLLDGSSSSAKSETKGSFDNFKSIFSSTDAKKRTQEGGIRRDEEKTRIKPAKDEIYWKESEEMLFEDAYAVYESGDYNQAIVKLHTFINQKPEDEMVKFAYFALGHSYILTNNTIKAKEIFDKFILKYPGDELTVEAENVVSQL